MQPARHHHPRSPTLSAFSLRPDISLSLYSLSLYLLSRPLSPILPSLQPCSLCLYLRLDAFKAKTAWKNSQARSTRGCSTFEVRDQLFSPGLLDITLRFHGRDEYEPRRMGFVRGRVIKIEGGGKSLFEFRDLHREGVFTRGMDFESSTFLFFFFKEETRTWSSLNFALDFLRGMNISRSIEKRTFRTCTWIDAFQTVSSSIELIEYFSNL